MAMSSWMESVTGHSNASSQAWRDNFNGGWAAGDGTGTHNAQIASDRADAGERNPEVLAHLPEGYRLSPVAAGPGAGKGGSSAGGSGGQGASPSQSGKGPTIKQSVDVARAQVGSSIGVGQITGVRMNFGNVVSDAIDRFQRRGPNMQEWDDNPAGHGQLYINGHKVVHDRGWSTGEIAEDLYGDDFGPATLYNWGKAFADTNATLAANGYPTITDYYNSTNSATDPWFNAGVAVREWVGEKYSQAERGWNTMVDNVISTVPPGYTSSPQPANPYSGNSPWSAPFN